MPRRIVLDLEHEPVQPDPTLNERRAGPFTIAAAVVAALLVVLLVLYGLSQPEHQRTEGTPASQPTANGPATTSQGAAGQNGAGTGQGTATQVPNPQEQDPLEQNTRP